MPDYYRAPGWLTRNVFNQLVAFLTRHGVSVLGSRVLAVKGRNSGQWRTTPVNLLTYDGRRFEGTGPGSSDDQIRAIAAKHPAFEVLPVQPPAASSSITAPP